MKKLTDTQLKQLYGAIKMMEKDLEIARDTAANAEGRVVVLPFKPEKGKTLIDVTEFIESYTHPELVEVDGSEITISFGKNGEITYILGLKDYTAEAFGTVIFESEAEAWAALEERETNG